MRHATTQSSQIYYSDISFIVYFIMTWQWPQAIYPIKYAHGIAASLGINFGLTTHIRQWCFTGTTKIDRYDFLANSEKTWAGGYWAHCLRSVIFPFFSESKHQWFGNKFIFNKPNCVKYECDLINLSCALAKSKSSLTEKLTKGALVTPTPEVYEWNRPLMNQAISPQRVLSIIAWMSNGIHHKVSDELFYPFSNFNGTAVEVWEWKNNII